MWPRRVYTHKKRAGRGLNLTPTPDLEAPAKARASSGHGRRLPDRCPKRKGKTHGLQKIPEKTERSGQGSSSSGQPSTQLRGTEEKSLQENSPSEEALDEKIAPLSESVTEGLQVDSSSSNSEIVSGLSLQHDVSSSLPSYSVTDSYTEYKSSEESLSSFPSPELFRGSDYLDWECPMLEESVICKNSTLLDTSKAVAIEKAPQFSNLSAILGTSSEDYQKCHRNIVMIADQNISPKPKSTSNSKSDNASCEVLLAEKTYPSSSEKMKKKPEKDPKARDKNFQTKLSSCHLNIKPPSSFQWKDVVENSAVKSGAKVLLPQPLKLVLNTNSSTSDKKSRGLLTSTPSSQTAGLAMHLFPVKHTFFEEVFLNISNCLYSDKIFLVTSSQENPSVEKIDLSSVQKPSFEELFPNVSNYVNSNEIVPVSSLQENSSNEVPSNTSEMCCIIKASPGTRQVESKSIILKKKKYSLPKDTPQDIIIKTSGRM